MTTGRLTTDWIAAVSLPADHVELAKLITVRATRIEGAERMGFEDVNKALKGFYLPSDEDLALVRGIYGVARSHAETFYASKDQFIRLAKGRPQLRAEPPVRMLTGPTGGGKTSLIDHGLARLSTANPEVHVDDDLQPFPIVPFARVRIRSGISHKAVLNTIAESVGLTDFASSSIAGDVGFLRLRLYQRGVCVILVDELQFLSTSEKANSRAAGLLTLLMDLGLPIVFVCNYRLSHKLFKRPPEERRRFLSNPMLMLPMMPDGPYLARYLQGCDEMLGRVLQLDLTPGSQDLHDVHAWTFGCRDFVRTLVAHAFVAAATRAKGRAGQVELTKKDLEAAYGSSGYAAAREIVEKSFSVALGHVTGTDARDFTPAVGMAPIESAAMEDLASQHRGHLLRRRQDEAEQTPKEREASRQAQDPPAPAPKKGAKAKARSFQTAADAKEILARLMRR